MIQKGFCIRCRICAAIVLCALFSVIVPVNVGADESAGAYNGFAGIYQRICIDGKIVCQSGDKFILTNDSASDGSDLFLPRYMGDGSYAFENKKNRKTHR